jgi:hypothetical protein
VHLGVERIKLTNCHGGASPESVAHMPFAPKALDDSVTKKLASNRPAPNFREGYEEWKEVYPKKKAGIYIVRGSNAVGAAEKTYRSGVGCDGFASHVGQLPRSRSTTPLIHISAKHLSGAIPPSRDPM